MRCQKLLASFGPSSGRDRLPGDCDRSPRRRGGSPWGWDATHAFAAAWLARLFQCKCEVLHLRAGFSAPIYSVAPGESLLHVEKSKTLINKHLEHRHFKLSYSLWKCHLVTTTNMSCAFHARLGNTWQRLHKRRHCCSCCGVPLCAPTGRGVPSHQTVRK